LRAVSPGIRRRHAKLLLNEVLAHLRVGDRTSNHIYLDSAPAHSSIPPQARRNRAQKTSPAVAPRNSMSSKTDSTEYPPSKPSPSSITIRSGVLSFRREIIVFATEARFVAPTVEGKPQSRKLANCDRAVVRHVERVAQTSDAGEFGSGHSQTGARRLFDQFLAA